MGFNCGDAKRFKKSREEEPRISIAPLIDIVFLLLIFFMVTSQFDIAAGIQVDLPKVSEGLTDDESGETITLAIDKSSRIYFEDESIDILTLRDLLQGALDKNNHVNLVLEADKEVEHGEVVQVMDLAHSIGIQSIIIAARWKSDKLL